MKSEDAKNDVYPAMQKVEFTDKRVFRRFLEISSGISAAISFAALFFDIPADCKKLAAALFLILLVIVYMAVWRWSSHLNAVDIKIEGSHVTVKVGDIFEQDGLKVIAFNEYFDTQVDNRIISERSINGIFINDYLKNASVAELDAHINQYAFSDDEVVQRCVLRGAGKTVRYQIGTICLYGDYLLTAFARFDENNRATLTMPEYLGFLINFWDRVNTVYAQKSVSTTIFGSGITRIKGHRNIADEDLLKIMLWTFRISEMRFSYPAKLTIVIHKDKIDQINLLDIKSTRNGV